jgi:acyl carrier protein
MTTDHDTALADARRAVESALLRIVPDADFDELDEQDPLRRELELDSLDFLSFVELLTSATGVRIEEADYPRLATLASATAYVAERLGTP